MVKCFEAWVGVNLNVGLEAVSNFILNLLLDLRLEQGIWLTAGLKARVGVIFNLILD